MAGKSGRTIDAMPEIPSIGEILFPEITIHRGGLHRALSVDDAASRVLQIKR